MSKKIRSMFCLKKILCIVLVFVVLFSMGSFDSLAQELLEIGDGNLNLYTDDGNGDSITQAGKTIQFVNMTNLTLDEVTAYFAVSKTTTKVIKMTPDENGVFSVVIPDDEDDAAYQTVSFVDADGNILGDVYNFLNTPTGDEVGVAYDENTTSTFYYGATETAGAKISYWGAVPTTEAESLASKKLYFDHASFPLESEWKLQIGNGEAFVLATDSEVENTLSYTFKETDHATQKTLLTITGADDTKYHFKWSNLSCNLASLNNNVTEVAQTISQSGTGESVISGLDDSGGKTIFFDTSGNKDSDHGWNIDSDMYIYLMYTSGNSGIRKMTKSTREGLFVYDSSQGSLWEYTVSAEDWAKCKGVIFLPQANWQSSNDDFQWQTLNLDVSSSSAYRSYANPCFKLNGVVGIDGNMSKKAADCYDLQLKSQAGKTMRFVNMTNVSITDVTANFVGAARTNASIPMTSNGNAVFSAAIPDDVDGVAYQTVYFTDTNGTQLGAVYNFFASPTGEEIGIVYDETTTNTFYYGVTEKGGTKISSWGAAPVMGTDSLATHKLYFDKLFFDSSKVWKLQSGEEAPVVLSADNDDPNTLSYTFDGTQTQQTLLTLIGPDGTEYHFKWNDLSYNLLNLNTDMVVVTGTYKKTNTIYFDATLSKLHYSDVGSGDWAIPNQDGRICYYAEKDDGTVKSGRMESVPAYSDGKNTWNDVYKVDLEDGYTRIAFSNFEMNSITNYGASGESTRALDIPTNIKNPCFYADTSDDVVYHSSDTNQRGGYWDEVYTIRDAENGKAQGGTVTEIVDIPVTDEEERQSDKKYLQTTFYDFYTDYELNGENRDDYDSVTNGTHRMYQPFRHFNQALSDYYKENSAASPLYWGNFQNFNGAHYSGISSDLNLYGSDNTKKFFYENNSMWGIDGNAFNTGYHATLGLVADTLDGNGNLMIRTDTGTIAAPFLNEEFLTGSNSKNAVLGKVYHDVSFPFTQQNLTGHISDTTESSGTVKYWVFDSSNENTNLRMTRAENTDSYYLKSGSSDAVVKGQTADYNFPATSKGNFFPFNGKEESGNAAKLNYGFATKIEFTFRLTDDGNVITTANEEVPIEFNFSGDDDVWVFIDGNLALDIGGAHSVVTGRLDFGGDSTTKHYYISNAKNTSTGGSTNDVTGTFEINGANGDIHTLTMFYMERGLWESNMKITFNFPDESLLEVEKQVDSTDVNGMFKELFENTSLFTYAIQNQATHYGTKEVAENTGTQVSPQNVDLSKCTLASGSTSNTFSFYENNLDTLLWYARLDDKTGSYKDKRCGCIGLPDALDISQMKYLQFKFFYDGTDLLSLSNMYLWIEDSSGNKKGYDGFLSGKTYGAVTMKNKEWVTVKIDLEKLTSDAGFDATGVKKICFGYNYSKTILLSEFAFYPSASADTIKGFTTQQQDIPDYGSATSGKLEIPKGAKYTSSLGGTYVIGADGTFLLQDGETITFHDQFRRGSYIALQEIQGEQEQKLFDTTWTMYESSKPVTSMAAGGGNTIRLGGISSLLNVQGTVVDDGRIERLALGLDSNNQEQSNSGYTSEKRPNTPAFVFRSYAFPDAGADSELTKLKVVYTNKVNVGSLILKKDKAYQADTLDGVYTFRITYTNIGGLALEHEPIEQVVTLRYGEEIQIAGIPLGTEFTVEEMKPEDGATLDHVEFSGDADAVDGNVQFAQETKVVSGSIQKEAATGVIPITLTFYNTKKPTVDIELTKEWVPEIAGTVVTEPDSIWIQLQRRKTATIGNNTYEAVPGYEKMELRPSYKDPADPDELWWRMSITGLDKVEDYSANKMTEWEYRFVELNPSTIDSDAPVVIEEGGAYVITKGDTSQTFRVSYKTEYEDITDERRLYTETMTNTLLGPANLKIIKIITETQERLAGVVFGLEMESGKNENGESVWIEPKPGTTSEITTNSSGEAVFSDLEDGTYRLTEVKTAPGHTLLKEPIIITINRKTNTYTWKMESSPAGFESEAGLVWDESDRTLSIKVSNNQNIVLPTTGGISPIPIIVGGMLLCIIACILYKKGKHQNRKKSTRRRENA